MKTKFVLGKIYHIEFLDHSSGGHSPMYMELIGLLYAQDDEYLYLTPWWVNTKNPAVFRHNMEKASVIKSTIKRKKVVKPFAERNQKGKISK